MEFNSIDTTSGWGIQAQRLNNNFDKASIEFARLENATTAFKGYFQSLSALTTAYPTPRPGYTAWVGTPFPGVIYKCEVANTWVATTDIPPVGVIPTIGVNGNWWIAGTDTSKPSRGEDGNNLASKIHYNVTQTTGVTYTDKQTARNAVPTTPTNLRAVGQFISYKLTVAGVTSWVNEQYTGADLTGWTTEANWRLVGEVTKADLAQTKTDLSNLIEETATGGNTYKVFIQGDPVVQFEKSVSEVYITGGDKRANRVFEIRWFGTKAAAFQNADLGIQIATRKEDNSDWLTPANYYATGTLVAGSVIKLNTIDPNAVQGIDVYVRLATTYTKPTDTYLQFIAYYLQLTPIAWNNFIPLAIQNQFDSIAKGNVTEIIISANESDTEAAFKGANAIQLALNLITDASATNRYRIYVKQGLYKITNSSQFLGNPTYPAMIVPKDHVDIVGQSKEDCIIHAELPYIDADVDTNISRNLHQTMYNWADDSTIENLTLVSKFIRYTLHQDSAYETNGKRNYKNVDFIFLGDKGFDNALGIGTYSGSRTFVYGGRSQAYTHPPVAIHNNQFFKKPSEWHFEKHEFINSKGDLPGFIYMSVCGSLVSDKLELIGCSFGSSHVFNYVDNWIYTPNKTDSFNHAEWRVTGYGNAPFYFKNTVKGLSLRIDAKEGYQNIRIDATSTAYASLLKNPHSFFGHLGHPERYILDGHVVFDSYQETKGYVIGGLSIYEGNYTNGTTQSVDGLGKRLGDCSVTNKELKLTIGVTALTILFNKNYTNMTNAAIIAEINTALGTYAVASEYNISLDYYPELTDVMSVCVNGTTSIIPKGTPLTLSKDRVIPATEGSKLFGVALDDFKPFSTYQGVVKGYGRVLRRGYISTINTDRFFVKVDSQSTSYRVGNSTLIADVNGSIKTIDNGIVGININ